MYSVEQKNCCLQSVGAQLQFIPAHLSNVRICAFVEYQ